MSHSFVKCILICLAVFGLLQLYAQPNRGTYYHHNYSPKDYKIEDFSASPQNWGIAQDGRGVLYICNTSGILEFDGRTWRAVPGTEYFEMFKAICGSDGRIYTGGIDEFGYLGAGPNDGVQYISLTPLLPDTIEEVGRIFAVNAFGDSIVFMSAWQLYIYHEDSITVIPGTEPYRRLLEYNGRLILQIGYTGLYELNGGKLIPLLRDELPDRLIFRYMFGPEERPLLMSSRDGIFEVKDRELHHRASILDNLSIWNGDRLNSEVNVAGSAESGAVIIDDACQTREIFQADYDMIGDVVIYPFFDRNDQLWLATSNGLRYIEYPGKLKYYDEESGLEGIPLCIDESAQGLMIGTTIGLFRQDETTGRFGRIAIDPQHEGEEYVTDFLNFQGDKLMLTGHGLFIQTGRHFTRINNTGGFDMAVLNASTARLVYGGDQGLTFVSKFDGAWRTDTTVYAMEHDIQTVAVPENQTVWASMFAISKIDISELVTTVTTLDSTHGFLPEMAPVWSFQHNSKAYFCTSMGLYSWNERESRLESDGLLGDMFREGALSQPIVMGDSAVWLYRDGIIGRVDLDTKVFHHRDLRRLDYSDVWSIQPMDDGHVWILTTEAVFHYDPSVQGAFQEGFHTLIRRVTTGEDSVMFNGYFSTATGTPLVFQPDSMQPTLDYTYNQLSISYAATYFSNPERLMYSTFLEGQDEKWSQWSTQPFKEFMNLREGEYTFRVKARNVYGVESPETTYAFSVLSPLYRTYWAYALYVALAGLFIWGIIALYTRRLRQQKVRLEGIVEDRTREIAEEKKKSDTLLANILPEETANELKTQGYATTRSYESITVLFTDFVSFTAIAETMSPEDLVKEIDFCFSAFDDIIGKEGIEKIKTIGDSYMCASGLNPALDDPEIRIVRAALLIRDFMDRHNTERRTKGLPYFQIRIGIHTGACVAGVVGKKKFAYDIWGDTVNTAARIESSSEPGEINISATTYQKVKDHIACDYRGMIEAKSKGKLDMYYVKGVLEKYSAV